jgi:hypothetical protein
MAMKRIFTIVICFLSLFGFPQNAKIEGIGQFKIDKTPITVITKLSEELQITVKATKVYSDIFELDQYHFPYIMELLPNKDNFLYSLPYSYFCPDVRVFKLSSYNISEFLIKNIYLTFFRDTLISFKCDYNRQLEEALIIKYGEPKQTLDEKEINCTTQNLGLSVTHKESNIKELWDNNNLQAEFYFYKYYDSECNEKFITGFSIDNDKKVEKINNCNDKTKGELEFRKKDSIRKSLDGL